MNQESGIVVFKANFGDYPDSSHIFTDSVPYSLPKEEGRRGGAQAGVVSFEFCDHFIMGN